jgi:hypothetical protein
MWGWETAVRFLREAGFARVERHVLPHDPMNVWFVARVRDPAPRDLFITTSVTFTLEPSLCGCL